MTQKPVENVWGSHIWMGLPGSSAGEESACNAGDPGFIPGLTVV